jgi:hypothetical protein
MIGSRAGSPKIHDLSDADDVDALDELSLAGGEEDDFDDSLGDEPDDESPEPVESPEDDDEEDDDDDAPFADELEARESVIYHPLPLNTIPTG